MNRYLAPLVLCAHAGLAAALAFFSALPPTPPLIGAAAFSACIALQYIAVSELVDFAARAAGNGYLNAGQRAHDASSPRRPGRIDGYTTFFTRWAPSLMLAYLSYHVLPLGRNGAPLCSGVWPAEPTASAALRSAVFLQLSVILADVFYYAFHRLQHAVPWIYIVTGHGYHHQFRRPVAREGTWLAFTDLFISASLIGFFNVAAAAWIALGGSVSLFEVFLALGMVHEMNACDHCGKVLAWHTCFPLLPGLESLLGLESIESHEYHHNHNKLGYGLSGLSDMLMGTAGKIQGRAPEDVSTKGRKERPLNEVPRQLGAAPIRGVYAILER
jgi:sterol desaturase/sphingolipid hydroxylase (fatty acid hydroxylase superfamily)